MQITFGILDHYLIYKMPFFQKVILYVTKYDKNSSVNSKSKAQNHNNFRAWIHQEKNSVSLLITFTPEPDYFIHDYTVTQHSGTSRVSETKESWFNLKTTLKSLISNKIQKTKGFWIYTKIGRLEFLCFPTNMQPKSRCFCVNYVAYTSVKVLLIS